MQITSNPRTTNLSTQTPADVSRHTTAATCTRNTYWRVLTMLYQEHMARHIYVPGKSANSINSHRQQIWALKRTWTRPGTARPQLVPRTPTARVLIILCKEHMTEHMYLIQVLIASTTTHSKFGPSNARGRARAQHDRNSFPEHLLARCNHVVIGTSGRAYVSDTSANSIYSHRKQIWGPKRSLTH